jgi:ribose-phosphate pyrophosphokinase
LHEVVITDSIAPHLLSPKIRSLSIAPLLAETIRRIRERESVSEIYT